MFARKCTLRWRVTRKRFKFRQGYEDFSLESTCWSDDCLDCNGPVMIQCHSHTALSIPSTRLPIPSQRPCTSSSNT